MGLDEAYKLSWVEVGHKLYGRIWREDVQYDVAREIERTIIGWSMAEKKDKMKAIKSLRKCPTIDAWREEMTLVKRDKQKEIDKANIRKAWHR